jgi:hypothetical protein
MDAQGIQALNDQIEQLLSVRETLRAQERGLNARARTLATQPNINNVNLRQSMGQFVPPHLMPGNVGPLNCVVWPFWFPVDFDYGSNYTIKGGGQDLQNQNFQVTQEAALLLVGITRQADNYATSGHLGPWTITVRDNQSSRQFNDTPIPVQQISRFGGQPTQLPTAMLLMPNAIIQVQMNSWIPAGTNQATTGPTHQQFSFFGYRIRIEDTAKVMSSVFMPSQIGG